MEHEVDDIVTVCPTYRGFSGRAPQVNGRIVSLRPIDNIVEFAGWDYGHGADSNRWYVPNEYLKPVIRLPDSTASADETPPAPEPVLTLYPSDLIILKHLKSRKSISVMEAFVSYGCARLAPRIYNLRAVGHDIETTYHLDEVGHRYCRYHLKEAA